MMNFKDKNVRNYIEEQNGFRTGTNQFKVRLY